MVFVEGAPFSAPHQSFAGKLNEVALSTETVVKVLSELNSSSAAGPDGLHPHLLKACSDALSLPLYLPFVRSQDEGVMPSLWRNFNSGSLI